MNIAKFKTFVNVYIDYFAADEPESTIPFYR
jgi:hypothetical protein